MPRRNEKTARNTVMATMRKDGYTYPEIAARFGITHQRVSQVLGLAGYRANPADRVLALVVNTPFHSDKELAANAGVSEYAAANYRKRHGLHWRGPGGWAETLVAGILSGMGLSPILHNHHYSHDITIGTLRIDVKECRKSKKYTNRQRRGYPQVRFKTGGTEKRGNCDIYVLVVSDPSCPTVFIVPASIVPPTQTQIVFSWPNRGAAGPKCPWREYRGRWDIITNDPRAVSHNA